MSYLDKRRKVFHYRHASLLPSHSKLASLSLQERLGNLLANELRSVSDRIYFFTDKIDDMDTEKHPHIAISNYEIENGVLFAQLVYVEPGNSVAVISKDDYTKESLDVEALNLNEDAKEYLDSVAFVTIVNNHVIILQSKAIRIKDIEEYINHLMTSHKKLSDDEFIVLRANNLSLDDISLKNKKIKNVNLTLPLSVSSDQVDDSTAFEVLRSLIGHQRLNDLKHFETSELGHLKIDINIGYKYSTSEQNQKLLSSLTQSLVDNRDESLTIEFKGAGRLVGEEIQVKDAFYLAYDKGLPMSEHVKSSMIEWLIQLLDEGVVNP